MGIFNKNKIISCGREGEKYSCDIIVEGKEKTIRGNPIEIANQVATFHITDIGREIPKDLKGYLRLATDPTMQEELDAFEKLAMKRQILEERAKGFPEEREFLDRIKNEVTEPINVKRMKEIGLERIAKFTTEEKRKKIK